MTLAEPATPAPVARSKRNVQPWDQLKGENDLWYFRFLRYVALGPNRSVSQVSRGGPNKYPVPAHWPPTAKQNRWRERAQAFDEAAKVNPGGALIAVFNDRLRSCAIGASAKELEFYVEGYVAPIPDDDDEDTPLAALSN